jgi:hypothetical protein
MRGDGWQSKNNEDISYIVIVKKCSRDTKNPIRRSGLAGGNERGWMAI